MLALAGACHLAVMSHEPLALRNADGEKVHGERREAVEDTFFSDLAGAIEWYSQATLMVRDGEYDARFEPEHKAVVQMTDGKHKLPFIAGRKG
jgi:hypothetical protein